MRFTSLPISISWIFRIVLVVAGFYLWGSDFVWALLGLYFGFPIIKQFFSCLLSLVGLAAFIFFLAKKHFLTIKKLQSWQRDFY